MDRSRPIPLAIAFLFSSLSMLPAAWAADTFYVTNTYDSGPGSLRDAMNLSNVTDSTPETPNRIVFHIGTPGVYPARPFTIEPLLVSGWLCSNGNRPALPEIRKPVVIDGFTQNEWSGVPAGVHL